MVDDGTTIRFPPELNRRIEALAKLKYSTFAQVVREATAKGLKEMEKT